MASTAAFARSAQRVSELCELAVDSRTLRLELLGEISNAVPFDAHAWLLTDPETCVGCDPLADVPCLPELPTLIRLKYLTPVNRWTALDHPPVALLSEATAGDRSRSRLWRDLLCRYNIGDIASMVFRDRFGCWGFLNLWRSGSGNAFTVDEASHLATISTPITTALRRSQASTFTNRCDDAVGRLGPVVLVLSGELEVRAQTPETEHHLRLLVPPTGDATPIPAIAYNVGAQMLAEEAGVDQDPPSARVHLGGGSWVTAKAARLGGDDIAITIEACSPAERMAVFGLAFGLSAREREILGHLATGSSTRDVARMAFVSEHTVQDHLKSIFAKTSTHNRRTLLSRALGN